MANDEKDNDDPGQKAQKPSGSESSKTSVHGDDLAFDTALRRLLDSAREQGDAGSNMGETVFQRQIELDEHGEPVASAKSEAPSDSENDEEVAETRPLKPLADPDSGGSFPDEPAETRPLRPLDMDPPSSEKEIAATRPLRPLENESLSDDPPASESSSDDEIAATRPLSLLADEPEDPKHPSDQAPPDQPEVDSVEFEAGETMFQPMIELGDGFADPELLDAIRPDEIIEEDEPEVEAEAKPELRPELRSELEPGIRKEATAEPEVESEAKPEFEAEARPEIKTEAKPEVEAEAKPEVKAEAKPEVKTEAKPEIKTEAKPEVEAESKPEIKTEAKPEVEAEAKPEIKTEAKPEVVAEAKPEIKTEAKPEVKTEAKPEVEAEAKPEIKTEGKAAPTAESKPRLEAKSKLEDKTTPTAKPKSEPESKATPPADSKSKPEAKATPVAEARETPAAESRPKPEAKATPKAPKPEAKPKPEIQPDEKSTAKRTKAKPISTKAAPAVGEMPDEFSDLGLDVEDVPTLPLKPLRPQPETPASEDARSSTMVMSASDLETPSPSVASTEVMSADRLPGADAATTPTTEPEDEGVPLWQVLAASGVIIGLVAVVVGVMSGLDETVEPTPAEVVQEPERIDLAALHAETLSRASRLSSRLTTVLTDSRTTREKLEEIEAELAVASPEQASILSEQRDQLVQDSERLIEKAGLIRDQVMKDVDFDKIQDLNTANSESLSDAGRQAMAAQLTSTLKDLDSATLLYEQLEGAIAARKRFRASVARWRSYGLSWPINDEDLTQIVEFAQLTQPIEDPELPARELLAEGRFSDAAQLWTSSVRGIDDLLAQLSDSTSLDSTRVFTLLTAAELAMEENHLTSPEDDNAFDLYREVLSIQPDNEAARDGLARIIRVYSLLMDSALGSGNFESAERFLARATDVSAASGGLGSDRVQAMSRRIREFRDKNVRAQLLAVSSAVQQAEARGDYARLVGMLEEVERIDPNSFEANQVREAIARVEIKPGRVFVDSFQDQQRVGPQMVVLPLGQFTMGEVGRQFIRRLGAARSETPAHNVDVSRPLAFSTTEITVGDFRKFIDATGYRTDAEQAGAIQVVTGRGEELVRGRNWRQDYLGKTAEDALPVIHVSWNDAQAYAKWLSESTGQRYRLPSESEFEYALRGGVEGRFLWGEGDLISGRENLNGQQDSPPRDWEDRPSARGDLRRYRDRHFGPAPVAKFGVGTYGLFDMLGNVAEWTQDCYVEDFKEKGADQGARERAGCATRVVRGSDWAAETASLRVSYRQEVSATGASNRIGIRVVRDFIGNR